MSLTTTRLRWVQPGAERVHGPSGASACRINLKTLA